MNINQHESNHEQIVSPIAVVVTRALTFFILTLALSMGILNLFGSITAGIWLAILGEWKVIAVGLLIGVLSLGLITFALMPGTIGAKLAVKAIVSERRALGVFVVSLSWIYATAVVVVWSYWILRYFYGHASGSSQIPLLLWSYGTAAGPWMYMASRIPEEAESPHPVIAVFFHCLGYLCCMLALIFWGIPVAVCLWILAAFMLVSCVVSASVMLIERRLIMALVNTNNKWERIRPNDQDRG